MQCDPMAKTDLLSTAFAGMPPITRFPLKSLMKSSIKTDALTFCPKRRSGSISTQLMIFLIFVVFPASWTAFAPVSTIKLVRSNQSVTASVTRCMYFVVPYYSQQLTDVSNVRVETFKGAKQGYNAHLSEDQNRPNRRSYSENNSELVLSNGKGDEARAPIDSSSIDATQRNIEAFITHGEIGQYSVSILANRTLFLLSFPIILLTVLYVLIQTLAITRIVLGNPYWPFSVDLANQMVDIARARRDGLKNHEQTP